MSEYETSPDAKSVALGKIKDLQRLLQDYIDDSRKHIHPIVSEYAKKLTAALEAIGNAINSGMIKPTEQFEGKLWGMQEAFLAEAGQYSGYAEEQIEERYKKK